MIINIAFIFMFLFCILAVSFHLSMLAAINKMNAIYKYLVQIFMFSSMEWSWCVCVCVCVLNLVIGRHPPNVGINNNFSLFNSIRIRFIYTLTVEFKWNVRDRERERARKEIYAYWRHASIVRWTMCILAIHTYLYTHAL